MTDEAIGTVISWLCRIPIDAGIRIRIYCDECEMAFGAGHPANAGWNLSLDCETLVECLQLALEKKREIDDWVAARGDV